ncbi:MAG: acyltransferase [Actinobacteria bacterium]|nr:acyltransferase [Actinomycetota bacterium]MCB9413330.1 acyltransferase [Actinomycetota bacterium]
MSHTIIRPEFARPEQPRPVRRTLRADIQGLRALAVLLVFANHLWGWPRGGYIGVDVFFVISGYLITGLLIRERRNTGRISFREFYARRMRRIFPMATLVLAVTVGLGYALLFASEAQQTLWDALWAFVFLENWHLISVGTDYFHAADGVSAVQQYWSLSVEEQFYLVWPALLVGLWWLARRLPASWRPLRMSRRLPVAVLAAATLASFGWALWQTGQDPTVAYFSSATRMWELGVGALLAFVAPAFVRLTPGVQWIAARLGLVLIAAAALLLTETSAFPGPWALLPVLGATLVVVAGIPTSGPDVGLLTNPVAGYIGKISYSLYLWHFPIIVFALVLAPPSPALSAAVIALTFGLSALSYRFVEQPVRRSTWLSKRITPRTQTTWRAHLRRAATLGAVLMLCATLVTLTWHNANARLRTTAAAVPEESAAAVADLRKPPGEAAAGGGFTVEFPDEQGIHQAHLRASLAATEWPELQIGDDWDDWSLNVNSGACSSGFGEARFCTFGDPGAEKRAVLFGDSNAAAWFSALRPTFERQGYYVEVYYLVGCTAADVPIHEHQVGAPRNQNCEDFRADVVGRVADLAPDLTIVTSFWRQAELAMSGITGPEAENEWRDGTVRTLEALSPHTSNLVVLDSPPGSESIKKCKTAGSVPTDCQRAVPELAVTVSRLNSEAVARVNQAAPPGNVRHQGVEQWFCVDGTCPALLGDLPIYTDGIHISPIFALYLVPLVAPSIVGE